MPRKKKIQESAPSLFDATEWEAKRQEIAEGLNTPYGQKFREEWDKYRTNTTVIMPPLSLVPALVAYSAQMAPIVRKALLEAGMSPEDVDVIIRDYNGVLWAGPQMILANPEQMEKAMNAITWPGAYIIDRWGLHSCLWAQYEICRELYAEYVQKVTGENATPKTRAEFWLSSTVDSKTGSAKKWLIQHYISKWEHYPAGEMASIGMFANVANMSGMLNAYIELYCICKYAYNATAEELAQITIPDNFLNDKDELRAVTEEYAKGVLDEKTKLGQELAGVIAKYQKNEKLRQNEVNRELRLHENVNKIGSKNMQVLPDRNDLLHSFPIQMYIDDFVQRYPEFGPQTIYKTVPKMIPGEGGELVPMKEEKINENGERIMSPVMEIAKDDEGNPIISRKVPGITEKTIHGIFDAINLLPHSKIDNGTYRYDVSIGEVTKAAGIKDANVYEKKAIMGALKLLHNLWFLVESPIYYKPHKSNGKIVKHRYGGREAVNLIALKRYGLDTGTIIFEVSPEAAKGTPIRVPYEIYEKMRDKAKGLIQARFNKLLLSRGQKSENDLVNDIFGFEFSKSEAEKKLTPTGDEEKDKKNKEEYKNLLRYISSNKAASTKKVLNWFEDYQKDGILTFERKPAKTGGYVYKWHIDCPEERTEDGTGEDSENA